MGKEPDQGLVLKRNTKLPVNKKNRLNTSSSGKVPVFEKP
jgi:hypothetical protein